MTFPGIAHTFDAVAEGKDPNDGSPSIRVLSDEMSVHPLKPAVFFEHFSNDTSLGLFSYISKSSQQWVEATAGQ
jgi:hypothetical protein